MAEKDYIITTDSNTELPLAIAKKYNVTYVPMDYLLDDKEYFYDLGENTDFKAFFGAVRSGKLPTTSTYPPQYYVELWQPILESGKDVLHLGFSSQLSAAYRNLSEARDMLNEEFGPRGRKVETIDLLSISGGAALLVYKALQMKEAGAPLDEVADWVRNNATRAQHWFMVNDLNHLRRGGRLSTTTAIVGSVLNVKPILIITREGKVIAYDKVMGRRKAINYLADKAREYAEDAENNACIILHADCPEEAEELRGLVETVAHFKEVYVQYIGPVIGTHAGPDAMAICFMGKERPE